MTRPLQAAGVSRIDVVRARILEARFQLAAGRRLAGDPRRRRPCRQAVLVRRVHPGGHAGIPEVCIALAELRATMATGLRRLRRYARTVPVAHPRALTCLGWSRWLDGRHGAARRAWARAIREAERLAMPYELGARPLRARPSPRRG